MKARIKIYCTGKYGKAGEQIVDLKKVEYFKNGKIASPKKVITIAISI